MKHVSVQTLGVPEIASPLRLNHVKGDGMPDFTSEAARILNRIEIDGGSTDEDLSFEKAGPREKIFFDPAWTRAAIVTCGGLCPGLNNVIRSLVIELYHNYGVRDILGVRYGYQGMTENAFLPLLTLDLDLVDNIDRVGGSFLGCSRGNPPVNVMAEFLINKGINILFTIGGDGTQRCALEVGQEVRRRGSNIAVVGVPKTVDNDLLYVDRTFGVSTAIDRARDVLDAAHTEAKSYPNGISVVKLMGRDSGFIAAGATLASQQVNFVLIPELPFRLDGPNGFLSALKDRICTRHHALIVVAEGAGQDLITGDRPLDASGNAKFKDIGTFLKEQIGQYFVRENIPVALKYIDPSYYIRSVAAASDDSIICDAYARNAVHAAMAGKTELIIGKRAQYIHVPMAMATVSRQKISLESDLWRGVLSATGQPARFE